MKNANNSSQSRETTNDVLVTEATQETTHPVSDLGSGNQINGSVIACQKKSEPVLSNIAATLSKTQVLEAVPKSDEYRNNPIPSLPIINDDKSSSENDYLPDGKVAPGKQPAKLISQVCIMYYSV